jgi:acyl-[acyl carrier protein]--UDP-N-acetylglucosamine O-acyltransferase
MATAHIAHDCHIGDNAIIVNGVALAGHVTVEFAVIGGLANPSIYPYWRSRDDIRRFISS